MDLEYIGPAEDKPDSRDAPVYRVVESLTRKPMKEPEDAGKRIFWELGKVFTTRASTRYITYEQFQSRGREDHQKLQHLYDIYTAYSNFIQYLESDAIKKETYLWDLVSQVGYIFPAGINLYIIEGVLKGTTGEEYELVCPLGCDTESYTRTNREVAFILKNGNFYEPIVRVKTTRGLNLKKKFLGSNDARIKKLIEVISSIIVNGCKRLPNQYYLESQEAQHLDHSGFPALVMYRKIQKVSVLSPKIRSQVVDNYYKVIGFVTQLKIGRKKVELFLPCEPSGLVPQLPIVYGYTKVPILDYASTSDILVQFYTLTKEEIPYLPAARVINDQQHTVGIITAMNALVPVIPSAVMDPLPVSTRRFYLGADDAIYFEDSDLPQSDQRKEKMDQYQFEEESYQRLRYEISQFLSLNVPIAEQVKAEINEIITYPSESLQAKYKKLAPVLAKILGDGPGSLVRFTDHPRINLAQYRVPMFRSRCGQIGKRSFKKDSKHPWKERHTSAKDRCNSDLHCIWAEKELPAGTKTRKKTTKAKAAKGGKCQLRLTLNNIWNDTNNRKHYISLLMEEFIRNPLKRTELLTGGVSNLAAASQNIVWKNELLLSDSQLTTEMISSIYQHRADRYINSEQIFEYQNPPISDSNTIPYDKAQYMRLDLPKIWTLKLKFSFTYLNLKSEPDMLYLSILTALPDVSATAHDLKQRLLQYIMSADKRSDSGLSVWETMLGEYRKEGVPSHSLRNTKTPEEFKTYFMTDHWATLADVELLSALVEHNIVILENRRLKANPSGITTFEKFPGKPFIMLLHKFMIIPGVSTKYDLFYLVGMGNQFLFNKAEFSEEFRSYMKIKPVATAQEGETVVLVRKTAGKKPGARQGEGKTTLKKARR